jgi:glucose/arabinose dehydrogenase
MRYTLPLAGLFMMGLVVVASAEEPVGYGYNPALPKPEKALVPTVKVAKAIGWRAGGKPTAAAGLQVNAFADQLDHPRWIYTLPNGDVLVAETNAPPKPDEGGGIRGWFTKKIMKRAGAATQSANRITLLRDTDGDGVADLRTAFLENLHSPFGMALVGNTFYVSNTDAVVKFTYADGATEIKDAAVKVADLPGGTINHHWTKNLVASADGKTLYASVGSNSNVGENGMDKEENRAAILKIDAATGATEVFASGLRNPVGMDWQPGTDTLWTAVNERDELGDDLVPDYMTSVKQGGFYGWPYSYYGQNVDERVEPKKPDLVAKAIVPDYALGGHTASLGLTFYTADLLPAQYKGGVFIGQHGSWNRSVPSGYKVVYITFKDGKPDGMPQDFLTGFLDAEGNALGRPVGVETDGKGALLVADDVGNVIWRVAP